MSRGWGALCVLCMTVAVHALGPSPGVLLVPAWTFVAPSGSREAVTLPAHFNGRLGAGPARFLLRAVVPLPPSLRGQRLTFAIPHFAGRTQLRAGGEPIEAIEGGSSTYRSAGPHAWRIPGALTAAGALDLELSVEHEWPQSAWFDTVPRLSDTSDGDAASRLLWRATDVSLVIALVVAVFLALTYGRIFFYARTQAAHGWFSLQALGASSYPLYLLGGTQALGRADTALMLSTVTAANIAGVHFMHAYFRLGRPPLVWRWAWAVCLLTLVVGARGPFAAVRVGAPINAAVMWCAAGYQIATYARLVASSGRPRNAGTFLCAWVILVALASVDLTVWMGCGEPLGGFHPACVGVTVFGLLQYAALSHEHGILNVELTTRVRALEAEQDRSRRLATELQRQIEERSIQIRRLLVRPSDPPSGAPADDPALSRTYRFRRQIGAGGMGTVHEAERQTDGVSVAVKMVSGEHTTEALARLAREAQLAARVSHPNLVSILDVGTLESGGVYLVMELVDGPSLEELRRHFGNVPWAESVLRELAEGLSALHSAGVVHRDLKPSNILLKPADAATFTVKICDFGIAMLDAGAVASPASPSPQPTLRSAIDTSSITQAGVLVGTPQYMAPELAEGWRAASPVSDIFGLGVIAYELVSGRSPFAFPPILDVRARLSPDRPRILAPPGIGAELGRLVEACLEFDPALRPTAAEVARALASSPPVARPAAPGRRPVAAATTESKR